MNPLWNDIIIAGKDFLGYVDKIGTAYEDRFIATRFGSYLAIPILRAKWRPDLIEGEARALLEGCLRVLFYRDCRVLNYIQIAKATKNDNAVVSDPYDLETNWSGFEATNGDMDGDGGWW